jgi:hypothetical protein
VTSRARLAELVVGDPPTSVPSARDRVELNLLGLRVPALATAFLFLACALLMLDRNYDVLPRFGPLDPRSLRNQGIERLVLFGLVPLGVLLALREDPRRYGLGRGDVRRAVALGGLAILVTVPAIAVIAAIPAIRDWYSPSMSTVPDVTVTVTLTS